MKKDKKDRFDLEDEILKMGFLSDLIKLISEKNENEKINSQLEAISVLLDFQTERAYDTMCEVFNLNKSEKI
jgi:hypothetical protein